MAMLVLGLLEAGWKAETRSPAESGGQKLAQGVLPGQKDQAMFPPLQTSVIETCGQDETGERRLGCDVSVTFLSGVRRIRTSPDQFEYRYLIENHGAEPVTVLWWGLAISASFLELNRGERAMEIAAQSQREITFVTSAPPRKTYTNAEIIVRLPHGYYSREVITYFGDEF
jgi:hypothetical protein